METNARASKTDTFIIHNSFRVQDCQNWSICHERRGCQPIKWEQYPLHRYAGWIYRGMRGCQPIKSEHYMCTRTRTLHVHANTCHFRHGLIIHQVNRVCWPQGRARRRAGTSDALYGWP